MSDKRLSRIEDKLDKVIDTLAIHSALHARNTESLEHHIKRTDLLEESTKPLKQTDSAIRFSIKAISFIGVVVAIIVGILKIT